MSRYGQSKPADKRTEGYCFSSTDFNDPRIAKLKEKLKYLPIRYKRVGRMPKAGTKWQSGYLPLRDALRYDVYLYIEYNATWQYEREDWQARSRRLRMTIKYIAIDERNN